MVLQHLLALYLLQMEDCLVLHLETVVLLEEEILEELAEQIIMVAVAVEVPHHLDLMEIIIKV
jgi:hypothetical protein